MTASNERYGYGWYPLAVVTLIARLFRLGKVELRNAELLDARSALEALRNPRQHGGVRVRMQEAFDASKINALKRFHQDFFNRANPGTDPRSAGLATLAAFATEATALKELLAQTARYAFLSSLEPIAERVGKLADKDYAHLLNQLNEFQGPLLDAKQDLLDPIKSFMAGAQRTAYDEAIAYLREEEANFADLPAAASQPLRDLAASSAPYRGQVLPMARTTLTVLRAEIAKRLDAERATGLGILDERETQLRGTPEFQSLPEGSVQHVLHLTMEARKTISEARFIPTIRDRVSRYTTQDFPTQLASAAREAATLKAAASGKPAGKVNEPDAKEPLYLAATSLRVSCGLSYIATEADLDKITWVYG